MTRRRVMTEEMESKAQQMRETGMTYQSIGDALGVSFGAIQNSLTPGARERRAAFASEHKEEIATYQAAYTLANRDGLSAKSLIYREENKERLDATKAAYREKNRARLAEYTKNYNAAHPSDRNARNSAYRALVAGATIGNMAEIKEIYRKAKEEPKVRCYLCGDLIKMGDRHVDHIMPLSKGGSHRPSNLAVACASCNMQKHNKVPEEAGILL